MAIKNEQFLKELLPFSKVTVVPGVTVGDLNFASAQSVFSTCYFQPSADETFDANQEKDLFQAAIGDNGQGLAAGQVMTRGQTNFVDSQGRLPANEVYVGIRCLVSAYKHTNSSNADVFGAVLAASKQAPITDVAALYQILSQFSWEYQVGDGIIRNSGALMGFPQGGGVYQPTQAGVSGTTAAPAIAAQSGWPNSETAKDLPIPFMFLPNITTRVKIRSGSKIIVEAASGSAVAGSTFDNGTVTADYLAVRMTFQGYKLTMPV